MDKDIRAALFDGFDDEGEFEELQDDFVADAMGAGGDTDFDFDAHIAKLIARRYACKNSMCVPLRAIFYALVNTYLTVSKH
jgi:hypothetical protein